MVLGCLYSSDGRFRGTFLIVDRNGDKSLYECHVFPCVGKSYVEYHNTLDDCLLRLNRDYNTITIDTIKCEPFNN